MHSLVDPSVELAKWHAGVKIALSILRWRRYKRLLMNILTFTTLFPSANRPNFCIFVFQRMSHVAKRSGNTVVSLPRCLFSLHVSLPNDGQSSVRYLAHDRLGTPRGSPPATQYH